MAVDPKTGEPVADAGWAEIARGLAGAFPRIPPLSPAEEASFYDLFGVPAPGPPPPADPRGVSALRGAYGPWLAAQEWAKAEAKRQP
jgi:hypothetical protein